MYFKYALFKMKSFFKYFIPIFFLVFSCLAFANPFTGNKNSPSPPRKSNPGEMIVKSQIAVHTKLGDYIAAWKENKSVNTLLLILSFSFLYGVIHAAGPGHRKTVVFSFYLSRKSGAAEPFLISTALAASHAGAAVFLALIFKGISGAVSVNSNNTSIYLEITSFFILILLSLYSIVHCISELITAKHAEKCGTEKNTDGDSKNNSSVKGCPDGYGIEQASRIKLSALLLSGFYPCPAALLIVVLTSALNITALGFFSVLALSAGMSLPITASGYLAWAGRKSLFFKLQNNKRIIMIISAILEISSYLFLLFFSVYSLLPFLLGLLK